MYLILRMVFQKIKFLLYDLYEIVSICLLAALYVVRQLLTSHQFATDLKPRKDEVAIVTGGNRGIGLEVVKQLMRLQMHVIMACRNPADCTSLLKELSFDYPDGKVEAMTLDLSSLSSVREFAKKFLATQLPLHLLVNNAGIMITPYSLTSDGFESQFQVNYLSHFLLSHLLLPKLKQTGSADQHARIVNVSSCAAHPGIINFKDLQSKKYYSSYGCYAQSKLAQIMFTWSLQEELCAEGAFVTVSTLHPGVVCSDLYRHLKWFQVAPVVAGMFFKTPVQGANAVVHAASSPSIEGIGGRYYLNCQESAPPKLVLNREIRRRLSEVSRHLVGLES